MAEGTPAFLNKKAAKRLHSADDLDSYLHVTQPSVWVILAACVLLVFALLVWGAFGTVNLNVNGSGVYVGGQARSFLPAEAKSHVEVGNAARVGDMDMRVASVARIPLSPDEVKEIVGSNYLVSALTAGEQWVYEVDFEGNDVASLDEGVPLAVSITANEVTPLQMVFGKKG